jgi:hypothetical protein
MKALMQEPMSAGPLTMARDADLAVAILREPSLGLA